MLATKIPTPKWFVLLTAAGLALLTGCMPPGPKAILRGDELLRAGKPAEAIEELTRATNLMPHEPRGWNLLGVAYHRAGQPQLAAQAYRQALTRDRSNVVAIAHFNLGCLLLEQNNAAAAVDELRSYTLITNSVAGLIQLGTAQSRIRQQWDAAENSFRLALQMDARNAEAWNGIGLIHAQRNQRDSMQFFNAALQSNPKHGPALLNSAIVAQQNAATRSTALQRYRDYLNSHGNSPQANAVRAVVRQLESDLAPRSSPPANPVATLNSNAPKVMTVPVADTRPSLAVAKSNALAAVLKSNQAVLPSNPPPVASLPPVIRAPVISAPVTTAAPVSTSLPVTVIALTNPAAPRVAAAQPVIAERSTPVPVPPKVEPRKAPVEEPPPLISRREPEGAKPGLLSRLNPFRGKPKAPANGSVRPGVANTAPQAAPVEAISSINEKPSFPRYAYTSPVRPLAGDRLTAERLLRDAQKAHKDGNTDRALLLYKSAIDADPTYFEARYNAALLSFQAGEINRALEGWEMALALEPASVNARYSLALALKQANYPEDAVNELEKIIEGKPDEGRAHLALGNLYAQQLNQRAKARLHYQRFLELEPRSPQASSIRFWLAANP